MVPTNAADDAGELAGALLSASRVLVGLAAHSLAEVEGTVTLAQFRALVVLEGRGEVNLQGLAEALGVQPSTALRMVDRLIAAELVVRHQRPDDRREVVLALTAAGRRLVASVTRRRATRLAGILEKMPAGRRAALVEALEEFAAAAGEPPVDARGAPLGW